MARRATKPAINLRAQEKEILERAKAKGVEHSYLFVTAFQRYQEHISHLEELEKAISQEGTIVTKEYVKGRENLYVNPAINAYNSTAGAADKTAQLLLKYLTASAPEEENKTDAFDSF